MYLMYFGKKTLCENARFGFGGNISQKAGFKYY